MLPNELKRIFPGDRASKQATTPPFKKRVIDSALVARIEDFILGLMSDFNLIGLNSVVIGISGGVDSAVASFFLKQALGRKSSAVIVDLQDDDTEFSVDLAEKIGINYQLLNGVELFKQHLAIQKENSAIARIHLRSRLVNNIVFQVAENLSAAVVDTTDKSERLLSMYAESFRGHFAPLIDLYKSELYDFVDYFNLPPLLKERKSGCPDLFDVDAYGVSWEVLDPILHQLIDKKVSTQTLINEFGIDAQWLEALQRRISQQHIRTQTKELRLAKDVV